MSNSGPPSCFFPSFMRPKTSTKSLLHSTPVSLPLAFNAHLMTPRLVVEEALVGPLALKATCYFARALSTQGLRSPSLDLRARLRRGPHRLLVDPTSLLLLHNVLQAARLLLHLEQGEESVTQPECGPTIPKQHSALAQPRRTNPVAPIPLGSWPNPGSRSLDSRACRVCGTITGTNG